MEHQTANPFVVGLFFVLRCMIPLVIMLGVSYLLKRLGVIAEPPAPPEEYENREDNDDVE